MQDYVHFSRFLGTSKHNNLIAVFHRLNPSPVYLEYNTWTTFLRNCNDKKFINILRQKRLIIDSKQTDKNYFKAFKELIESNFRNSSILYLILTKQCNLECNYCFIRHSSKVDRDKLMKPSIAKLGIDVWARHISGGFNKNRQYFIIFYGGEPLLNLYTLQKALEYIQLCQNRHRLPRKNLNLVLATNGTLLNRKIAKLLKRYNIKVSIGLDGIKNVNDYYRKDSEGNGTFNRVIRAMTILRQEGVDIWISSALTPYSIRYNNRFINILERYKVDQFGFNILRGKTLPFLKRKTERYHYYKMASDFIVRFSRSSEISKIYERQIEERLRLFKEEKFCIIDCGGCTGQLVIHPNGDITNCPLVSRRIQNLTNTDSKFRIWDTSITKNWQKRLPLYNKRCTSCNAISICGGGCPWNVHSISRNIALRDNSICVLNNKVFEDWLWTKQRCNTNIYRP